VSEQPPEGSVSGRDRGLQPERTALAWQRTALSMAGAALIVVRLALGTLGAVAVAVLVFCLGHAAVLFQNSHRSYGVRTGSAAHRTWSVGLHGALLSLQVLLLAMLEVAALVLSPPH